jgi:hypothetical protein
MARVGAADGTGHAAGDAARPATRGRGAAEPETARDERLLTCGSLRPLARNPPPSRATFIVHESTSKAASGRASTSRRREAAGTRDCGKVTDLPTANLAMSERHTQV